MVCALSSGKRQTTSYIANNCPQSKLHSAEDAATERLKTYGS